jgi:myosin heavy subunit
MPDDEVSTDRTNWIRACDLEELGMNTMLELPDGTFKGPYNPMAIDGLAKEGKIPVRAVRFNKSELEERMANRQMSLFGDEAWEKPTTEESIEDESKEQFEQQLEQVRQEANDAIELAQREAEDLRVEREKLMEEISALQQSAANNQKLDEVVAEKEALESELAALKEQGASMDQQNAIIQDLQSQAQLLAEQLSAAENERDSLVQKLEEQETAQLNVALENAPASTPVEETEEYISLLAEKETIEQALVSAKELAEQAKQSLEFAVKAHEEDVKEQQKLLAKIDLLQEQATNLSAELAVSRENNDLSKDLLSLAEAAKKELTDALTAELSKVEEATTKLVAAEEKLEVANQNADSLANELAAMKQANDTVNEELAQLQEEYSELLDFSNTRDSEHNIELAALKQQLEERPEVVQTRREQMLEVQLKDSLQEIEALREQLANISAQKMTEDNYSDDDISLIKRFADESINVLRKTLEEEKEANLTARAKSIERQRVLHEELQRLERVMQRDPGELTRAEMSEQRANKQIAKLQQELESERRHHQADVARADANSTALEQRYRMQMQKEAALREQLSVAEARSADFDSVNNLLRRRENALLAAEKEFEEARQQWKMTEETLLRRIEELENGAGLLFDNRNIGVAQDSAQKPSVSRSGLSRVVLHK